MTNPGPILGKGGKVDYGMHYAIAQDDPADIVFYTDTDLTTDLRLSGFMIAPILQARAQGNKFVSLGSRVPMFGNIALPDVPVTAECVLSDVGKEVRKKFSLPGVNWIDTQAGYKAFPREVLQEVLPYTDDPSFSFDTELQVLSRTAGAEVKELGIFWADSAEAETGTNANARLEMLLAWMKQGLRLESASTITSEDYKMIESFIRSAMELKNDDAKVQAAHAVINWIKTVLDQYYSAPYRLNISDDLRAQASGRVENLKQYLDKTTADKKKIKKFELADRKDKAIAIINPFTGTVEVDKGLAALAPAYEQGGEAMQDFQAFVDDIIRIFAINSGNPVKGYALKENIAGLRKNKPGEIRKILEVTEQSQGAIEVERPYKRNIARQLSSVGDAKMSVSPEADETSPMGGTMQADAQERAAVSFNNIALMKDLLDPTKEYKGYNVVIIATTSEDERSVQEEQFESMLEGREVYVLSVNLAVSGGGQIIDTMRAYKAAVRMAREKYSVDLDKMWAEGKAKIGVFLNAGKGTRASPLSQAENNSRGAIRMVGKVKTTTGEEVPISLLNLTFIQNNIFGYTNDGRDLDVLYTSQIYVPTKDVLAMRQTDSLFTKFGTDIEQAEELTVATINELGIYEMDRSGNIYRNIPKKTLMAQYGDIEKVREHFRAQVRAGYRWAFSMGAHRMKRDLFKAFMEYYGDKVEDPQYVKTLKLEPPDFINPLLMIAKALETDVSSLTTVEQVLGRLDAPTREVVVGLKTHKEVIEFMLQNMRKFGDPRKWIGLLGVGSNIWWWKSRSPLVMLNNNLMMIADVMGHKVEITGNGGLKTGKRQAISEADRLEAQG